ncbi:MAG: immune inhibitor A [Oscillochloridaceae bacterium]|nr:immune inhibitor A [Chloroflexaceae bacterium]MDW8391859.1 immune inhibitor A [Oscillochloridaceae bacterium]
MKKQVLILGLLALILAACAPFNMADPPPSPSPTPPATVAARPMPAIPTPASPDPSPIPVGGNAPRSTPAPTAPVSPDDAFAALDAARRAPRDPVELARALGACRPAPQDCPTVSRNTPLDVQVGEVRSFYVTDLSTNEQFEVQAELRYAGPIVLMYVEQGLPYNQADLEAAARTFEQEIYPRTREIFGSEVQPGVDGDRRITILNASDPSGQVLGYFSAQDLLPRQVNRFSNEREMFFMNLQILSFADEEYLEVLAHEFQHMIHQNEQPGSPTWFNEGASQLAEDLNGYFGDGFTPFYLFEPDVQLTAWSSGLGQSGAHYGAAHLFMRYVYAQYASKDQLLPLIRADAGNDPRAFVALAARRRPDITTFSALVADWAVANLIDDPAVGDGRYTYDTGHELPQLLPFTVQPVAARGSLRNETVAQFGADYYALPAGAREVRFRGATSVGIASEPARGVSWWSGRSDDSYATLTRAFDLSGLNRATLQFATWYEIENDYDYAFVSVSNDGGQTWETLPGSLTTEDDPQGMNYGHGITGVSGAPGAKLEDGARGVWVEEKIDLTPYAGQRILLRFWQINDQGFNAPGMLIDDIRIPELGYADDAESGDGGWEAAGFVRTAGVLPQRWELRLVRTANGRTTVEALPVDAGGSARASLVPGEQAVLVILGATPHTTERAAYQLDVE